MTGPAMCRGHCSGQVAQANGYRDGHKLCTTCGVFVAPVTSRGGRLLCPCCRYQVRIRPRWNRRDRKVPRIDPEAPINRGPDIP